MPTEPSRPKKPVKKEKQMLRPPVDRMMRPKNIKALRRCVEYDETHWPQRAD